ncbi:MAG: hypothetical protein KDA89_05030 [Planctomycetaceae bacterium]|nr:hypothetical protein [Planctomycetaceae bacterium]
MKSVAIRAVVVTAILIPFAAVFVGLNICNGIDDAYAQWGAAEMVIEYMEDHGGKWPADWNSLRPYFDEGHGHVGGWSYEYFQSRIFIDFTANAERLKRLSTASDSVPFDVIHANSIWGAEFEVGPNEMVYLYFQQDRQDLRL